MNFNLIIKRLDGHIMGIMKNLSELCKFCVLLIVSQVGGTIAKYTLEEIMCGDKYGIESAVLVEVFKMSLKLNITVQK